MTAALQFPIRQQVVIAKLDLLCLSRFMAPSGIIEALSVIGRIPQGDVFLRVLDGSGILRPFAIFLIDQIHHSLTSSSFSFSYTLPSPAHPSPECLQTPASSPQAPRIHTCRNRPDRTRGCHTWSSSLACA